MLDPEVFTRLAGNDHLAFAREACNDRANGIVASVTGAFGLRDSQLHELLSWFVGSRNHVVRLYPFVASVSQDSRFCINQPVLWASISADRDCHGMLA